jgi:hypothetical protein
MKSKVTFDLDGQNRAVIQAQIIYTDDVRDKIAVKFKEAFRAASSIAVVHYLPPAGGEGVVMQITPLPGNLKHEDPHFIRNYTWNIGRDQVEELIEILTKQLNEWKENEKISKPKKASM